MKMKKGTTTLFLLLILSLLGCGGDKTETSKPKQTFVTIVTGGSSGAYFALGGAVSNLLNQNIDGVNASVQSTGGSVVNSTLLGNKKAEIAFAMNDVVSYASTGTEVFKEKGVQEGLVGIAALYPNFVQLVTLEETGIETVADLRGKRVGVGAPGSGTEVNARQILGVNGITYDDIKADYLSYSEAIEQMKNGSVDAAFLTSGIPNSTILDLGTTKNAKIVPIKMDTISKLAKDYPFYSLEKIPAGTYGNDTDVETAAVQTLLVTRSDIDEDLVYNITKTVFENLETLRGTHSAANNITLDSVATGMPIPFHPGAKKYFDEVK